MDVNKEVEDAWQSAQEDEHMKLIKDAYHQQWDYLAKIIWKAGYTKGYEAGMAYMLEVQTKKSEASHD